MGARNHHYLSKGDTLTRVKINTVSRFDPIFTYHGMQLDRTCQGNVIVEFLNQGSIGVSLVDAQIAGLVSKDLMPSQKTKNSL